MIYGYARVSTRGQARDGNSLADQEAKLRESGCEQIFYDSCTGTKMNRPQFSALMEKIQPGDTLVVTKLDRFARTAWEGAKTIQDLVKHGVTVNVLNMGVANDTAIGKVMVTILLAFAEFERDMIVERTSAGKAVARETRSDWREGRKAKSLDEKVVLEFREKIKKGDLTVTECCKALGISRTLWYNRIRDAVGHSEF